MPQFSTGSGKTLGFMQPSPEAPVRGAGNHNEKGIIAMRKFLLAGAAALVTAVPAAATNDNSGYVGVEGGLLIPKSQTVQGNVVFTGTGGVNFDTTDVG